MTSIVEKLKLATTRINRFAAFWLLSIKEHLDEAIVVSTNNQA